MDFLNRLESLIKSDKIEEARIFYESEEFTVQKSIIYWELASLFCTYLNKQCDKLCDELGLFIEKASIELVSKYGNAKELLLVYLEHADLFKNNDKHFHLFIQLMQIVLLRIEEISLKSLYFSLEMTTNAIHTQISKLEIPLNMYLENNELLLFDNDPRVDRVVKVSELYVEFLNVFLEKALKSGDESLSLLLTTSFINLLHEPFLNLNLEKQSNADVDTDSIKLAKLIYKSICKLNKNSFDLILRLKRLNIKSLSLSVFIYLSFGEKYGFIESTLPQVYDDLYLFELFEANICDLICCDYQFSIEKGIKLAAYFFERIQINYQVESISISRLLECKCYFHLTENLFKQITYSSKINDLMRKKLTKMFLLFFKCFSREARFQLLLHYMNIYLNDEVMNNYLTAYLIYLFKEELADCLNASDKVQNTSIFKPHAKIIQKIYTIVFKLRKAVKTDLINECNRIISSLNLLRFLIIRDKKSNYSGIIAFIKKEKTFLSDLEKAIKLSKAHYQFEIKNIKENINEPPPNLDFEINNLSDNKKFSSLNMVPTNQQRIDILKSSIQTFELIESLRVRVLELLK